MVLISFAYLISTTLSVTFLWGLLFYNRNISDKDPLQFTIIRSSFLLPGALVNIFSGIIVDRYSKKKVMVFSELINAIAVVSFFYYFNRGFTNLWFLAAIGFASSMIFSFYEIALDASMVDLAGEKLGEKLISVIWLMRATSWIIGPQLGAYLYKSYGMKDIFFYNAISFIVSAALTLFLHFEKGIINNKEENREGFMDQLNDLIAHIKKTPIMGFLFTLNLSIALFYLPIYDAIVPNMATSLGFSDSNLASIESSAWIGVAIGSIVVSLSPSPIYYLKNLFHLLKVESLMLLAWLFPLFLTTLSLAQMFNIFIVLTIIDGAINAAQTLGALTYFQIKVPKKLRGKILGTTKTVMRLSAPIGTVSFGLLLKYIHWSTALLIASLSIISIVFYLSSRPVFKKFAETIE